MDRAAAQVQAERLRLGARDDKRRANALRRRAKEQMEQLAELERRFGIVLEESKPPQSPKGGQSGNYESRS